MASINYLLLQTAKNVVILSLIYITLNPVATAGKGRTKTDEVKTTLSPVAHFMGEKWHARRNKPTSQRSTDHPKIGTTATPYGKTATTRSSWKRTKPTTSTTPSSDKRRSTTKAAPYFCPVHEKSTNRGIFLWPETQAGKTAVLICPHDPSKKATRVCKSGKKASWKSADYKTCPKLKKNSMEIFNITEEVVDSSNVENIGKKIRQLSKNKLVPDDVANTAVVLERIVRVKGRANEVAVSVFDTVDNILDADDVIVATSQRTSKSSTRIVRTLTNLLEQLNTTSEGGSFKKSFKNFIVDVETVDPGSFTGLSFSSDSIGSADNVTKQQDGNVSTPVSINFPKTLFKNLRTRRLQTLVVTVYKKLKFFNLEGSKDNNKMVNSFIMAGKVKNVTVTNLTDPVVLTFGSLMDGKEDSTECVFWDFDREIWSSDGCRFEGYEDGKAVCHCDHMTNFAMLMDVDKTQDKVHGAVLSIVSYIGCMLSLIGLILTILTILFFRDLRSNAPTQILLNFCLALTLTLIVFLAGAERSKTTSMLWCRVAAIALHYFILATFFWMVMEAINMYLAFVKVMPSYVPQFMLKCMLTAWGIPAIIVAITAGVAYDCYGDEQFCRLNGHPFVFAFLVPVLIILIGNSMAFFVIFRSLVKTGKKTTADLRVTTYQRARHGAAVFVVLGLTWVFGIFAIKDARILFQYLFCIFNSLQGLLVFVLYCLLPQTTRDKYKRFFGVHRLYRMSTRTSSLGESTTRSRTESHETPKTNQVAAAVNTV